MNLRGGLLGKIYKEAHYQDYLKGKIDTKRNVLVITASPREKSSCNILAAAFAAGALANGSDVRCFDAAHCDMTGTGAPGGRLTEDGLELNKLIRWADILLIASPVSRSGFPSRMKAVANSFYSFAAPGVRASSKLKNSYLFASSPSLDPAAFEELRGQFHEINELLELECKGEILSKGVAAPDDLKKEEVVKAAVMGYWVAQPWQKE